jgi:polyisoprenoid-binding protein YceI
MEHPETRRLWQRRWVRGIALVIAIAIVAAVVGPFVYIHFIEGPAPAPLKLAPHTGTTIGGTGGGTVAGTWKVSSGSQAGYRVQEVLVGQNNTAVGRTSDVTGQMTIAGSTVTAATFTVDLTTVHSDQAERDVQFEGRIMDTARYPTATFTLSAPIELGAIPAVGQTVTAQATGSLDMHGVNRGVTLSVQARYTGSAIEVSGSIPVLFANWDIANPSFGPVTTQSQGIVEFLLDFSRTTS